MATEQDLQSLLKQSGSVLLSSTNHLKYKLPNGKIFITPKTPSDFRSYTNCLSFLRRELRMTHPGLADTGRNLPKSKRWNGSNSIADILAAKQPISAFAAIPGSQPKPLPEAEFQIIEPEPEPEPEIYIHKAPRAIHEPAPKPGQAKTLTSEQLAEANRIFHAEGQKAMDEYLNQCRSSMVAVTREIVTQRLQTPIKPFPSEDSQMMSIVERAQQELALTTERLNKAEPEIAALKQQLQDRIDLQEKDVLRQAQLEQYISKYQQLAEEATALLTDVLPPVAATPMRPMLLPASPKSKTVQGLNYGLAEIRDKVFPIMRREGKIEFNPDDLLKEMESAFGSRLPSRSQLTSWLFSALKSTRVDFVKSSKRGYFTLVEPHTTALRAANG